MGGLQAGGRTIFPHFPKAGKQEGVLEGRFERGPAAPRHGVTVPPERTSANLERTQEISQTLPMFLAPSPAPALGVDRFLGGRRPS